MMDGSTMICETAWDEAPSRVVFKGRNEWDAYISERTCHPVDSRDEFGIDDGGEAFDACSLCARKLYLEDDFCSGCGARVERDA